MMLSNHLILCRSLPLLPSIFPSRFFSISQLFTSGGQSTAASASASASNLPMNIQGWFSLGLTDLISLLSKGLSRVSKTLKSLLQHRSSKASILQRSAFCIVQLSYPYMTTGKSIALTIWTFVGKAMSLLFNTLSRLVIAFLPRNNRLLISWLQSPSTVILEPKKIESVTASIVSPSLCHEVMELDAMIFVFWMLSYKPAFSLSSFTFIKKLFNSSSLSAIRVVSSAYLRLLIFLPTVLIPACDSSSLTFYKMYSTCKLNKQSDNIQPWHTPCPILNQSVVPCPVLPVASWPAYRFLRRQVKCSGIPICLRNFHNFFVIYTATGFSIVNEAEVDIFLEFSSFLTFMKRLFSSSSLSTIRVLASAYLRLLIFLPAVLIPACDSSRPAFFMMYSAYNLNKQSDNIQLCYSPFPILNQSVVPCPVLTVASWPAYRFLKRQVRWSGIPTL